MIHDGNPPATMTCIHAQFKIWMLAVRAIINSGAFQLTNEKADLNLCYGKRNIPEGQKLTIPIIYFLSIFCSLFFSKLLSYV
jgi:hypothetical protein